MAVPFVAPGCLGHRDRVESLWPPEDFYVHAALVRVEQGQIRVRRSFQVFADGLAVLREAPRGLEDPREPTSWWPVFSSVCAYRLHPRSVRQLSRLLDRARLWAPDVMRSYAAPPTDAREWVAVRYRAFDAQGVVHAVGRAYGPVFRAVHVLNAYLPPGHALELAEMPGEAEETHVIDPPLPVDDVAGALRLHRRVLLPRRRDDVDLLIDTYVLALAAGEWRAARDLLGELERIAALRAEMQAKLPVGEPPPPIESLRRLFESRAPG